MTPPGLIFLCFIFLASVALLYSLQLHKFSTVIHRVLVWFSVYHLKHPSLMKWLGDPMPLAIEHKHRIPSGIYSFIEGLSWARNLQQSARLQMHGLVLEVQGEAPNPRAHKLQSTAQSGKGLNIFVTIECSCPKSAQQPKTRYIPCWKTTVFLTIFLSLAP